MTQEAWVKSQTRAMTGWVNSKIPQKVDDLRTCLGDGLVLIDLINAIVSENKPSLTPVYKKPKFALQKMENIDDALKYCRLVLQVSTCNISAEDIVGGNLKLILGLIWTLFVFATSSSLSSKSESKSFSEIKSILLHWLNDRMKHHALDEISNFNIDWSLQKDKRPDLMFASIFDHYSPGIIDYRDFTQRKPLANLSHIISEAKSHFGIEDLALADDFNVLVPDEKSILLYVLQWYMHFVVEPQELITDSVSLEQDQNEAEKPQADSVFSMILKAKKSKNQYDTRSLRLLNQMTANLNRFRKISDNWKDLEPSINLASQMKACWEESNCKDSSEQVGSGHKYEVMRAHLDCIEKSLKMYEVFRTEVSPSMIRDFPELKRIYDQINSELVSSGLNCKYEPLKSLQLGTLLNKCQELHMVENTLRTNLLTVMKVLSGAKSSNLDNILQSHRNSNDTSDPSEFILGLEAIKSLQNSIMAAKELLQEKSNLKLVTDAKVSEGGSILQPTGKYLRFRDRVSKNNNQQNLTYTDLKKLLRSIMSPSEFNGPELHEIIRLIPARTILSRTESETFSDDSSGSIDSCVLFEEASKSLEHKLSGNYNKIYDLSSFLGRLESGFSI